MTEAMTTVVGLRPRLGINNRKNIPEQDSVADAFAVLLAGALSGSALPLSFQEEGQEQVLGIEPWFKQTESPARGDPGLAITSSLAPLCMSVESEPEKGGTGLEDFLALTKEQGRLPQDMELVTRPGGAWETMSQAVRSTMAARGNRIINNEAVLHDTGTLQSMDELFPEKPLEGSATKKENPELITSKAVPVAFGDDQLIKAEKLTQAQTEREVIQPAQVEPKGSHKTNQEVPVFVPLRFAMGEGTEQGDTGLSVGEAARFFRQALEQASRQKGSGRQEVTLKLNPPNLGRVHLTLVHRTGAISARFEVENDMARGALQTNMAELKESLVQQGIQVEELSVFMGQGSIGNNQFADRQDGFLPRQTRTFPGVLTVRTFLDDDGNGYTPIESALDLLV